MHRIPALEDTLVSRASLQPRDDSSPLPHLVMVSRMRRTYQHRDLYKHLTMLMILALSMCVKVRASSA
ncbi:MAG: hypothetical protein VX475_07780, partial [Myxococcota bacterium]|nr:hypothetical protein [Myxococcota bacterium]